jgi:hypothetical protein
MLNGQKLQGPSFPSFCSTHLDSSFLSIGVETAKELHEFLRARNKVDSYPLFAFVVRLFLHVSCLSFTYA